MPSPFVSKVADIVDGLSEERAEDIWDEVKESLRSDGEIPDSDEDMTSRDWGLVTHAFKQTIVSRFDVSMSDLTEKTVMKIQKIIDGKIDIEDYLEEEPLKDRKYLHCDKCSTPYLSTPYLKENGCSRCEQKMVLCPNEGCETKFPKQTRFCPTCQEKIDLRRVK